MCMYVCMFVYICKHTYIMKRYIFCKFTPVAQWYDAWLIILRLRVQINAMTYKIIILSKTILSITCLLLTLKIDETQHRNNNTHHYKILNWMLLCWVPLFIHWTSFVNISSVLTWYYLGNSSTYFCTFMLIWSFCYKKLPWLRYPYT